MIDKYLKSLSREDLEQFADGLLGINLYLDETGVLTNELLNNLDMMQDGKAENVLFAVECQNEMAEASFKDHIRRN